MLVVEDLYVKGLIKNKKQSRHWADLAHGEFRRMLKYKSEEYGKLLVEANRWFPSSKLCSNCLIYNTNLTLKDRIFHCPHFGIVIDRDYNAAINLEQYFYMFILPTLKSEKKSKKQYSSVAKSSVETLNAGGETVRPVEKQARLEETGKQASLSSWNICP